LCKVARDEAAAAFVDSSLIPAMQSVDGTFGIISGLAGILLMLREAILDQRQFIAVRDRIFSALDYELDCADEQAWRSKGPEFDLFGGLSGTLGAVASCGAPEALVQKLVRKVETLRGGAAVWTRRAPGGGAELDYGVAHGLAGILAVCNYSVNTPAVASMAAVARSSIVEALQHSRVALRWRPMPPMGMVSAYRWCHGSFSIALTLWFSGRFFGDSVCTRLAEDVMVSILETEDVGSSQGDPFEGYGPGLCHGLAGAALMTAIYGQASGNATAQTRAHQALQRLLSCYDFEARAVSYDEAAHDGQSLTFFGLVGVALALLALLYPQTSGWLPALGLPRMDTVS
jgi:hypothetical protein